MADFMAARGQVDDLTKLTSLDEGTMVGELSIRYNNDKIYTYIGDILVAINPFRQLSIYSPEIRNRYKESKKSEVPPHIFAIADAAYHNMTKGHKDQCCLVSGESGAGKTESAKLIIRHIMHLCHASLSFQLAPSTPGSAPHASASDLEMKILQVNPLLEAFGNAQTIMNDNSSRFGKYTELMFSNEGRVIGARISEYLLEKSRVVHQANGEENFHIFYYLLASPDATKYQLSSSGSYDYLSKGSWEDETEEMYKEVSTAFNDVGFDSAQQNACRSIIAAILHLGNVRFASSSVDDPAYLSPESLATLRVVAKLLELDIRELQNALTTYVTQARGEIIERNYTKEQAIDSRDAMAKALYGRLFGWIVSGINSLLAPAKGKQPAHHIGILDIFGFENFDRNGFEQFCINLANEQLQHFFNEHIFQLELSEYALEGIDSKNITYVDNRPLLTMFLERPMGLFALLDEESMFPKSTDASLVAKFVKNYARHPHFIRSRREGTSFTIKHYAGSVEYLGDEFLEKNRDSLAPVIVDLLQGSGVDIVAEMFLGKVTSTGSLVPLTFDRADGSQTRGRKVSNAKAASATNRRPLSVGAQFKNSLVTLVERMNSCQPHFVRCIKPNTSKAPFSFEDAFVLVQLRYTGMLETTRIRREGYSVRPTFAEFIERFKLLAFGMHDRVDATAENCRRILAAARTQGWLMGRTKVFLKYFHMDELDAMVAVFHKNARILQKTCRGFVARARFRILHEASMAQKKQVSAFLELMALMCSGKHTAVVALCAADKRVASELRFKQEEERLRAQQQKEEEKQRLEEERKRAQREEEERRRVEEEARRLADQQRLEAERRLKEEFQQLEAQRVEAEQRVSDLAAHMEAERQAREALEAKLREEAERAEDERNRRIEAALQAEMQLREQAEQIERERLMREEAERDFKAKLAEEAKRVEEERKKLDEDALRMQQELREQAQRAENEQRESLERSLAAEQRWQDLATKLEESRKAAEESLAEERRTREELELKLAEAQRRIKTLEDEVQGLEIRLEEETRLREDAERQRDEEREVSSREQLLRTNAEELIEEMRASQIAATAELANLQQANAELDDLLKTQREEGERLTGELDTQTLTAQRLGEEKTELLRILRPLQEEAEKRRRDLTAFSERADAIRALARGSDPKINMDAVDLSAHIREMCTNIPATVRLSKFRCAGYLVKQGAKVKSWNQRWFVLDLKAHNLSYFVDESESAYKGDIPITEIIEVATVDSSTFTFVVATASRNYQVRAGDRDTMDVWMRVIRSATPFASGNDISNREHEARLEKIKAEAQKNAAEASEKMQDLMRQLDVERRRRMEAERLAMAALKRGEADAREAGKVATTEAMKREKAEQQLRTVEVRVTDVKQEDSPERKRFMQNAEAIRKLGRLTRSTPEEADALESAANLVTYVQYFLNGAALPATVRLLPHACRGFLLKQGDIRKNWLERFFVLDLKSHHLTYWADDRCAEMKGKIPIFEICKVIVPTSDEARSTHSFLIVTNNRTYYIRAPSPQEMVVWVKVLGSIVPS